MPRAIPNPSPGEKRRAYNSVYVIDHDGTVLSVYDKVHLVPFGEYLPFQDTLEKLGLMQLTKVRGGFLSGTGIAPTNCAARRGFSADLLRDRFPRRRRSAWRTAGLAAQRHQRCLVRYQLGSLSALSAGEGARDRGRTALVRAANSGISAVVDPLGRVVRELPLGTEGVLDAALPRPIAATMYARFGDAIALSMLAVFCIIVLRYRSRRTQ